MIKRLKTTAGPWRSTPDENRLDGSRGFCIYGEFNQVLAKTWNQINCEGNARLIAAAPDMLESLSEIQRQAAGHMRSTASNDGINIALENIEKIAVLSISGATNDDSLTSHRLAEQFTSEIASKDAEIGMLRKASIAASRERNAADRDIARLRKIISECATALGTGAFIAVDGSIEMMEELPNEIRLTVGSP